MGKKASTLIFIVLILVSLFIGLTLKKVIFTDKVQSNKQMIKVMKEDGYTYFADALEEGDFKKIDYYINTMTDEDYKEIIGIIKKCGYTDLGKMMESIKKEDLIKAHNHMYEEEVMTIENEQNK